jgi:hypothetical protein
LTIFFPFSRWPTAPLWRQIDSKKGKRPETGLWISAKRGTIIGGTWNGYRLCVPYAEVGRCTFDKPCTDLFFDIVDRRYENDCANTMILTSNTPTNNWDEFFTGDDTLLCTLDRIFDKASVFMMRGPSYRGKGLDTYSVEAVPQATKQRGAGPMGV